MSVKQLSRRDFMRLGFFGGSALAIVACSPGSNTPPPTSTPRAAQQAAAASAEAEVLVGDVLDYALLTDKWTGGYGWVQCRLHEGRYNGEPIYYIRTDSSDAGFATENKLVHVPLLRTAEGKDIASALYLFDDNRPAVLSTSPADENFASLNQVKRVTVSDSSVVLDSAESVEQAAADGAVNIEETTIFVNYPVVQWPGGALPVDDELTETLGKGPLTALDVDGGTVTFKLHKCYPGSRYIITDTSAVPMAPMMSIAPSAVTQGLKDAGGTDEIWVFANGIAGPGVMGFQPAIFDNKAGSPAWSPFWDHFTVKWADEGKARLLTSSAEIRELVESGELELFNGVPDSHPNGFVVNCPAPILAPNDFKPA